MKRSAALALALVVGACAPAGSAPPGVPASYEFALTVDSGILALDERGRIVGTVFRSAGEGIKPTGLSLAPDGRSLLFVLPATDPKRGFGSDVWRIGVDGSGARALVQHEEDYVFYASPVLDPSGSALYVSRSSQIYRDGKPFGVRNEIVRIDLKGGERRTVVADAGDLALWPDGRAIVYVHLPEGAPDTLWRVNSDGSAARALLPQDRWVYLQTPRISPDGARIAFSAAGRSRALGRSGTAAHLGIPSELVVVASDAPSAKELTVTNDDVWPAWAPDGARIAYVVAGALKVFDLGSGEEREIAKDDRFFFAELVWLRR